MLREYEKTRGQVTGPGVRRFATAAFFPPIEGEIQEAAHFAVPDFRTPAVIFDPQRRAASPDLRGSVAAIVKLLRSEEEALGLRQRRRSAVAQAGFKLAVEALTCNLAVLLMLGLESPLAVPRHNGAMWGKGRYGSPVFGQHFLDALDVMARPQVRLFKEVARGYGFPGGHSRRSTVRPTERLKDLLPSSLEWAALKRDDDPEVLVLRGLKEPKRGHAESIDYPETLATRRLRRQVKRINAYLRAAPLILSPGALEAEDDAGQPVDPTRRTVRRIFNNGSWEDGGRLYGGFWETMRREDRFRFLRIGTQSYPEGEPIANVDYGQLFVRLAYLNAGHTPPDDDLYDITGDGQHREGWKQLTNALLLTSKPLGNWPEGARSAFPAGTSLRDAIAAVKDRHAPVAHLFGCGMGIKLMHRESEMLIATLLALFGRGITALPLHDSVLVAASEAPVAEETMHKSFTTLTGGARASLKTTFMQPRQ